MSTWANTPRFFLAALFFGTTLALLLVFVFSVPAFAADLIVNDDAGCSDANRLTFLLSHSSCHRCGVAGRYHQGLSRQLQRSSYRPHLV